MTFFIEEPSKILAWLNAKGYSGTLNDAFDKYLRSGSTMLGGTSYDQIMHRLSGTGTLNDRLTTMFQARTGLSNRKDAERKFFQDSSLNMFAGGGINSYTKLMLHADSTFVDSSPTPHTMTANGGAIISSAQSVFGGASALMVRATSSNVTTPDSDDWSFGANPFTIDFRVRFVTANVDSDMVCQYQDASNYWSLIFRGSANLLVLQFTVGGSLLCNINTSWTPSINTWYWVKVTRTGSTVHIYIDGVDQSLTVSTAMSSGSLGNNTGVLAVGGFSAVTGYGFSNAYLEEVRIQNGEADDSTTVPTEAYS